MKEDEEVPLILGRPSMKTARIFFMVLKILMQWKNVYKRMDQRDIPS